MPFYQSGPVRLHYVCRSGDASHALNPVVFQHGIGGDVTQPGRFLASERTSIPADRLRVIHADFRGHGQSELGPEASLSIGTLARDLAALLDHLGIERAIVGGISMGAAVALRLAADAPRRCRALVLCRPAWTDGPMSAAAREAFALVADLLSAEDWQVSAAAALERSVILRNIEEICPDAAKSLRGQVQSVLCRPDSRAAAVARLRRLPTTRGLDGGYQELSAVRCPAVVVAAAGNPIHPFEYARELTGRLTDGRLVPIAPKSPLDDTPHLAEVDRVVGEFLRPLLS